MPGAQSFRFGSERLEKVAVRIRLIPDLGHGQEVGLLPGFVTRAEKRVGDFDNKAGVGGHGSTLSHPFDACKPQENEDPRGFWLIWHMPCSEPHKINGLAFASFNSMPENEHFSPIGLDIWHRGCRWFLRLTRLAWVLHGN